MPTSPRKGLKRYGLRGYIITGPVGTVQIERERRGHYHAGWFPIPRPAGFFSHEFKTLTLARAFAESMTGKERI